MFNFRNKETQGSQLYFNNPTGLSYGLAFFIISLVEMHFGGCS